jgi:tRNA U34 2-thiouridine synthase MnmA/TrmU
MLDLINQPRYGFGKNMNPCIDCHSLMFREAGLLMEEMKADFLISGEVLGQRPMSQKMNSLKAVSKHSGYRDYIIRPLSQKLLPDTKPIIDGIVKKVEMLDIQGRSRRRQIELATELGITDYPESGGGCKLTEIGFSLRLKDLKDHQLLDEQHIKTLYTGRHCRLSSEAKLIMGRNEEENNTLFQTIPNSIVIRAANCLGPIGFVHPPNNISEATIALAANIVLSYTNKAPERDFIEYGKNYTPFQQIEATKLKREELDQLIIKV